MRMFRVIVAGFTHGASSNSEWEANVVMLRQLEDQHGKLLVCQHALCFSQGRKQYINAHIAPPL